MELRPPAQCYWTTVFDRYQPQSLSFAFLPVRSLVSDDIPRLDVIATILEGQLLTPGEIHPWHLPTLLASILLDGTQQDPSKLSMQLAYGGPAWVDPKRLGFAEYVSYSDVIPFEESPLKGKSLMSIAGSAGVTIGLIAAHGTPLVILTVPLGILLCTAAAELGPELGKKLPKLMGLPW
jgi:hypothetical protein